MRLTTALLFFAALLVTEACDSSSGGSDAGRVEDAGAFDAGAEVDAGSPDAGAFDAGMVECTFNRDCPEAQRCACDLATGCFCENGARGMGVNGVDTCDDGNDCASALCVEGPASEGGVHYCSDECVDDSGCEAKLPRCVDISFIGRICVRAVDG